MKYPQDSYYSAIFLLFPLFALITGVASAGAVILPDTTQTTTFTATVVQQANVTVPANVVFNVTNVSIATQSTPQTVSATNIVLADGKGLRIEITALDPTFTSPGGSTWHCSDISWNAPEWNNGSGSSGIMSDSFWRKVAESDANATSLTTDDLEFTLAAKPSVTRAGDHFLQWNIWKFSSF